MINELYQDYINIAKYCRAWKSPEEIRIGKTEKMRREREKERERERKWEKARVTGIDISKLRRSTSIVTYFRLLQLPQKYVPIFDGRKSRKAVAVGIEEMEDRISCRCRTSGDKLKLK